MLHDLIMKHKASLQMFDNICNLVNEYTSSPDFSVNTKLQSWKSFLRSVKGSYCTWLLRPYNRNVRLHDGTIVTVPVFDMKEMLTSLLTDQTIMVDTNFADGYDVLTRDVDVNNPSNDKYGEFDGNISVRRTGKPIIILGQDESVYNQFTFGSKQ